MLHSTVQIEMAVQDRFGQGLTDRQAWRLDDAIVAFLAGDIDGQQLLEELGAILPGAKAVRDFVLQAA